MPPAPSFTEDAVAQLLLTSYERCRRILGAESTDPLTANAINKREITQWISEVSRKVERYCNRTFYSESRTEYFDVTYNKDEYWVAAPPVTTLTSVYQDQSGEWDGAEGEISDVFIGANSYSVVLPQALTWTARKGLRIIYTGGLATSGVRSVYAITATGGTMSAGYYVEGGTSGALGIVRVASSTALTVEVIYGVFQVGETLTEYNGALDVSTAPTATGKTATLDSVTTTSLAESYPDIVRAAELEIRFLHKHRLDFENTGTQQDGTTLRRDNPSAHRLPLTPEALDLLNPYRVMVI